MKLRVPILLVAALTLTTVSLAQRRPEPNAFFNRSAPTHTSMMRQIRNDEEVMDRFMRHFGMTRQQVLDYFDSLTLDTIDRDGIYLIYNVPETGVIRVRAMRLRKGTPIWVDGHGTPILKASCGNPLVPGSADQVAPTVEETIAETGMKSMRELLADIEIETENLIAGELMQPGIPTVEAEVVIPTTPTQPVIVPNPTGPITSGGDAVPFANLLSIVTGAIAIGSFGDSPNPIPEPATMAVLGAGVMAVGFKARQRTRKRKLQSRR